MTEQIYKEIKEKNLGPMRSFLYSWVSVIVGSGIGRFDCTKLFAAVDLKLGITIGFIADASTNKSQYWPRGAPKHAETAENEKAKRTYRQTDRPTNGRTDGQTLL